MRQGSNTEDANHESYFISFSDLLIGVLFLFIILLLGYGLSFRSAESQAAATMLEMQQALDELAEQRDRLELEKQELSEKAEQLDQVARELIRREEWRDDMLKELAAGLEERGVQAVLDLEKGVLRLPESLLFASGSAELTELGEMALQELAFVMGDVLPCYVALSEPPCYLKTRAILETVLIEGHTDNVPIRSSNFRDNWDLSVARGVNTYRALTAAAAGLDQMRNARGEAVLGVSGYETRRPVGPNDTIASRERNRRIDLRFLISIPNAQQFSAVTIAPDAAP